VTFALKGLLRELQAGNWIQCTHRGALVTPWWGVTPLFKEIQKNGKERKL